MDYVEVGSKDVTYLKAKNMKVGEAVEGTYGGSYEDQFDKPNFRINQADGTTKILNGTALLAQKFASIPVGTQIRVIYEGTNTLKKGKYAGKEAHSFKVLVASNKAATPTNSSALPF